MSDLDLQQHRLGKIEQQLDGVEQRLGAIEIGLADVRSSIRTFVGVATVLFVITCVLLATLGQDRVRIIAQQVVREELACIAQGERFAQQGRFAAATRVKDEPPTFAWTLKVPVDPSKVLWAIAEPIEFLPGIAVQTEVSEDGEQCLMTLHGATLDELPDAIDAKITVVTRE